MIIHTVPAPIPQQLATARILKTALPTIVPTPMSPSVIKVPITLTKSSGADVAAAINVAPATSFDMFRAFNKTKNKFIISYYCYNDNNNKQYKPWHIFSTAGTKYLSQTIARATNRYSEAVT